MTTITATPDPENGTVTIRITRTETITSLIRADVNGTRAVRVPAGAFPAGTSGTITIIDHEAAFHGVISYRAGTADPAWTAFPEDMPPRFTLPMFPTLSRSVELVDTFSTSRETGATVHEILGRSDPIIVTTAMKSRRGSFSVICESYDQAVDVEALLGLGKTVMYRQSENQGQDFYFHALSAAIDAEGEDVWKISVNFVALRVPADNLPPATEWTFSTLAALPGASFGTIPGDYESFATLAMGEAE